MLWNRINKPLLEEAGGDDGTGDAGGAGSTTPNLGAEQLTALTNAVGMLAKGFEELRGNQNSLTEALAALAEKTGQTPGEVKSTAKELFGDDVDLEQLSRKDLTKLILAGVEDSMNTKMAEYNKGISAKLDDLSGRFESRNAHDAISRTAESNADFWEWTGEIKAMLEENPTLTPARAYALVRLENKEKAEKMDAKYKPAPKDKKSDFIGLTPTSSFSSTDGAKRMTPKQAAENAFNEVMQGLDGIIDNPDS